MKKFCTGVARKPFFIRGSRRKDFLSVNPAIFSKLDIQARWKSGNDNGMEKAVWRCEDVDVVLDEFDHFMDGHEIQCIVSPANSYGIMDGGYDAAIINYFGMDLMLDVQKYILENYFGEQHVGSSFIINIPGTKQKLIHTPTMRIPSQIKEPHIIYQCMRTTLMTAIQNNVESIVIPAFGAATGKVPRSEVAELMKWAYDQIKNPPEELNWDAVI